MPLRKRRYSDMEEEEKIQKAEPKRLKLKLEDAPKVSDIKGLIQLGKSIRFYKNIDTITLWRVTPYLEELDAMIGMEGLKKSVFYQIIYYLQGMHKKGKNEEYLHTVLYGAPGCGKSTVAGILGKLYRSMNILSEDGVFKVAHRSDLIASYLGQTAIKTKKLLDSCIGGVLLLDEVYALAPRSNDRDSFSKECIDTLNAFLSEHKNDFCCIIAGYREEVEGCFFAMNKGLERRFPWAHTIDEYGDKDLVRIFVKMIKEIDWSFSFPEKYLLEIFRENKKLFKNFGGSVEIFLSRAKIFHAKRVFGMAPEHRFILNKEDISEAIEHMQKNTVTKDDSPPPGMYT